MRGGNLLFVGLLLAKSVHPHTDTTQAHNILNLPTAIYFQIYLFLGHLCASYAVAFIVSLAFESPMMGLEKALLGREKNS